MDVASLESGTAVEVEPGVHLRQLVAGETMSIQHLRMAPGATIPTHDHHHEQVGFVYQGKCTFLLEDETTVTIEAGGSYRLAGHEVHGVINDGDEAVLAIDIFHPPRPDPDWAE